MAIKIGSLIIRLAVEHGLLSEGLARSEKEIAKTTKAIERKGREIASFGQNLSLAVTVPILGLAAASIKAAKESADALGQVEAALNSMGNASGRTLEQLQALAGSQMRQSLFDDDQILREVTANLLTFGRISGEEFDRAQQAALDLSTRLGTDLTSATLLVGKALNDPVKGVSALSRAGIQFTADQKAMIASMVEAGDVAGAQAIILGELEKQFGGAAKAARDADPGAALAQSFANFQEEIGGKLLPLLPAIAGAITGVLDAFGALPGPVQEAVIVIGGLAALLGPVAIGIGAAVSAASGLIAAIGGFPVVASLAGAAMTTLLLSPLGLIVGAVAAVVAAWYYWDEIKGIVGNVGSAVSGWWTSNISPTLSKLKDGLLQAGTWWIKMHLVAAKAVADLARGVKTWLQDKLGEIFDWVGKKIKQVTGFFFDMYDAVVGNSFVPDMVEGIRIEFAKLQTFMVAPAQRATQATEDLMRAMADRVRGILARLYPEIEAANAKAAEIADLFAGERAGVISSATRRDAVRRAQGFEEGPLEEATKVNEAAEKMSETLRGVADRAQIQTVRIAESFRDMAQNSIRALDDMVNAIKGGGFLDILGSAVNLFLQLGSTGLFGKGLAGRINQASVPGFAQGTRYAPGGLAMVGERGPELVNLPRGSQVISNRDLRAANDGGGRIDVRVGIDPRTGNLTAFVDGRINGAAPMIAAGGAEGAMRQLARQRTRRVG